MKKRMTLRILSLVLGLTLAMGFGNAIAADKCPDNFVFLVDQSGSMYMHFGKANQVKMGIAKGALMNINYAIRKRSGNPIFQVT
jgi:hypothetical protein